MGIIRFLLACAVVIHHAKSNWTFPLLSGGVSVEAFFIISGFYMALVLESKYKHNIKSFYFNRWFRIAPIYYLVLMVSILIYIAASILSHHPVDRLEYYISAYKNSSQALLLTILPQLTIFGIELPLIFSYNSQSGLSLVSQAAVNPHTIPLIRFIFVPQAWSIGIELLFYVVVPYLNKLNTNKLIIIAALSFLLKMILRFLFSNGLIGVYDSAWLPPQLFLFILGMLACRHRSEIEKTVLNVFPYLVVIWLVLFIIFSRLPFVFTEPVFLVITALIIPLAFYKTKNIIFDRWIGNLSYPIYLCHIAVKWIILGKNATHTDGCSPFVLLFVSILVAILLAYFVEGPLDQWRHKTFTPRLKT